MAALDDLLLVGVTVSTEDRLYLTQYERNAVARRLDDGTIEKLVTDQRLLWPDTMSLAGDGYLCVTANQLHRQPRYHDGVDRRQAPLRALPLPGRRHARPPRLRRSSQLSPSQA